MGLNTNLQFMQQIQSLVLDKRNMGDSWALAVEKNVVVLFVVS
jgi:hypothetical protein